MLTCDFTREGGYTATADLLAATGGKPPVDCLFAVTDVMALGALAALRDAGLRVPEDIGLAGFDDIASLRDVVPGLTTVRLPMIDIGAMVVGIALDGAPPAPSAANGCGARSSCARAPPASARALSAPPARQHHFAPLRHTSHPAGGVRRSRRGAKSAFAAPIACGRPGRRLRGCVRG